MKQDRRRGLPDIRVGATPITPDYRRKDSRRRLLALVTGVFGGGLILAVPVLHALHQQGGV